jgi:hypothetical protein
MMDDKEKRRGAAQIVLNTVYILTALVILGLGAAAWMSANKRGILVPCIYGMAALMCALHMVDLIKNMPRGKKNWNGVLVTAAGIPLMIFMAALTYVCLH